MDTPAASPALPPIISSVGPAPAGNPASAMASPPALGDYAGFGLRLLAYLTDYLILFPIGLIVQQLLGNNPFAVFQAQTSADLLSLQKSSSSPLTTSLSLFLGIVYFLVFWVNFDGATLGKKLVAIKITKDDGEKVSYLTGFLRYLVFLIIAVISLSPGLVGNNAVLQTTIVLVSLLSFIFLLIDVFWIVFDKRKQALHDKIAGTVVVKTGKKARVGLAILFSVLGVLLVSGYMGAAVWKGFAIGFKEAQEKRLQRQEAPVLFPTLAPLATPNPVPDTLEKQAYSNAKHNFTIHQPKGWRIDKSGKLGTLAIFFDNKIDKKKTNPFAANINILSESAPGLDLNGYVQASKDATKLLTDVKQTDDKEVSLNGLPARIIGETFTQGAFHLRNLQLIVVRNNQAYVVTATALQSSWAQYQDLFESSLVTFTLK